MNSRNVAEMKICDFSVLKVEIINQFVLCERSHSVMSAKEAKSQSQPKMEATERPHSLKKEAQEGRFNTIQLEDSIATLHRVGTFEKCKLFHLRSTEVRG